eukprot:4285945-Lingulodinium_polyedra.AAC.1
MRRSRQQPRKSRRRSWSGTGSGRQMKEAKTAPWTWKTGLQKRRPPWKWSWEEWARKSWTGRQR